LPGGSRGLGDVYKRQHKNKKRNNFLMYDEEQISFKIRENKWFLIYFPFQ
jgi:hypothetical protein